MSGEGVEGPDGRRVSVEEALREFGDFLTVGKAVAVSTRECYLRHVRTFLSELANRPGVVDLQAVSAVRVRSYVTDRADRYAPESLKLIATAVRSFLRFAWMSGWTDSDLTGAVGTVVTHRSGKLPEALTAEQLRRLLASPDRRTLTGVRDYALLLLLSRLGLRAGEAAGLRLDDIDWHAGTFTATVKGGGRLTLPIPHDVGQALVDYLQRRATTVGYREVFLQVRGEPKPMTRCAVTEVVSRHAAAAGLGTVHAHRLRHSAARAVLAAGGTLVEVGELLGHSTAQVTMTYASFDLNSLAVLARPWPTETGDD
ncbi:site-specific recombinase XerD [Humibacillus xanthopallidus]|uniref:Site-specific recombinase XerD n=1 Tax=Humibacillus xanthopallidus TaxID=412689 RepID=A0A543PME7_9MICO|nr:tyrosine-type recombinase/integrase [Humibacillus xanthopallidus]TQN45251.1 site-specific recombinase XerD [Humibacillus xanthopallidus]